MIGDDRRQKAGHITALGTHIGVEEDLAGESPKGSPLPQQAKQA